MITKYIYSALSLRLLNSNLCTDNVAYSLFNNSISLIKASKYPIYNRTKT